MTAINRIVIGMEYKGSSPNKDHSQKDENMDNIKCSPWAKLTISINPKIKLRPAAISAYIIPTISPVTTACRIISEVMIAGYVDTSAFVISGLFLIPCRHWINKITSR